MRNRIHTNRTRIHNTKGVMHMIWFNKKQKVIKETENYTLIYSEYDEEYQIQKKDGWVFIHINNCSDDDAKTIALNILSSLP